MGHVHGVNLLGGNDFSLKIGHHRYLVMEV
jgi:hypothetical protein